MLLVLAREKGRRRPLAKPQSSLRKNSTCPLRSWCLGERKGTQETSRKAAQAQSRKAAYEDNYISIVDKEVVSADEDPEVAHAQAKKKYRDKEVALWKVPHSDAFIF